MLIKYAITCFFTVIILFAYEIRAQQNIDSSNVFIIDNLVSDSQQPIISDKYREFSTTGTGFTSFYSQLYFQGDIRRATRQQFGIEPDVNVQYHFRFPEPGSFIIYRYLRALPGRINYVRIYLNDLSTPVKFYHYYTQLHIYDDPLPLGSWMPLGIIKTTSDDSLIIVEIGLDNLSSSILHADGIKFLRSVREGPKIEFGNRRFTSLNIDPVTGDTIYYHSFYKHRAPLSFPETIFKWGSYSEKSIKIYNPGNSILEISGFNFQTNRFEVITPPPIFINPGEDKEIVVKFKPLGDENTFDELKIFSNDPLEPEATIKVYGKGINYNFILNASFQNTEPHWNIPGDTGFYEESGENWTNSTPSPWVYPIYDGNINSRVNTGNDPSAALLYRFILPDSLTGNYHLDYSGTIGSPNAAQNVIVDVISAGIADTQSAILNSRISGTFWVTVGGEKKTFLINGGETIIQFTNPNQGGNELLRADLLRIRLSNINPEITTSLVPDNILDFGNIMINDTSSLSFTIYSTGEEPLEIKNILTTGNNRFSITNRSEFPFYIPAIDGQYKMNLNFHPGNVGLKIDTLIIFSNAVLNDSLKILLKGNGIVTAIENIPALPKEFVLNQNYPNPFNPETDITYNVPIESNVKITVYNIIGNKITEIVNERQSAGVYNISFQSDNLASGVYFYRMTAISNGKIIFSDTKKMMYLK